MRTTEVRCSICGAGWRLPAGANGRAVRLVEEALERHEEQHRRIAVAGKSVAQPDPSPHWRSPLH